MPKKKAGIRTLRTAIRKVRVAAEHAQKAGEKIAHSMVRPNSYLASGSRVYVLSPLCSERVILTSTKPKLVFTKGVRLVDETKRTYRISVYSNRTGKLLDAIAITPPDLLQKLKEAEALLKQCEIAKVKKDMAQTPSVEEPKRTA